MTLPRQPLIAIASAAALTLAGGYRPVVAADFYAGKTITFIAGTDVGGGFSIYARAVAKHLARPVPWRPPILGRNKAGAGGPAGGRVALPSCTQGRHRHRFGVAERDSRQTHGREPEPIRPDQVQLPRRRRARHAPVRDVPAFAGVDDRGCTHAASDHRGNLGRQPDPRL